MLQRIKSWRVSLKVTMKISYAFYSSSRIICEVILDENQNMEVIIDGKEG